ncbi:uncharacterized protein MONOS_8080 [Monocercomonoides exilis]|uniref:uncharacterized protein n=1 Tax=Monocercomonoides exilis TaxID=2049356 RepID=UPI00355AC161|nr:hypothetical protein MONOS_8080 [Monocercomonoides exilis]|eukprot:MONOS_8080.1-p1 / transcript=MONOS_8080.1 / gene=MONOS_8080 / organism=Monocercomonoides_exilis_PA203 / gene_product=unspecified product / transcript_product=unspecified product / location=Mono_scaffold00295:21660-22076(+) / protein_length=139 / sequence_SO=supercontig / SO=protein_coding / is_pseudo=false
MDDESLGDITFFTPSELSSGEIAFKSPFDSPSSSSSAAAALLLPSPRPPSPRKKSSHLNSNSTACPQNPLSNRRTVNDDAKYSLSFSSSTYSSTSSPSPSPSPSSHINFGQRCKATKRTALPEQSSPLREWFVLFLQE